MTPILWRAFYTDNQKPLFFSLIHMLDDKDKKRAHLSIGQLSSYENYIIYMRKDFSYWDVSTIHFLDMVLELEPLKNLQMWLLENDAEFRGFIPNSLLFKGVTLPP